MRATLRPGSQPNDHRYDLASARAVLESKREELTRQVSQRVRAVQTDPDRERHTVVRDELAPTDVCDDLQVALLEMESDTLRRIDEALRLIDQGRYGACSVCGEPISAARLRALPFAVRCVSCEEQRERRHKRLRPDPLSEAPTASQNGKTQ